MSPGSRATENEITLWAKWAARRPLLALLALIAWPSAHAAGPVGPGAFFGWNLAAAPTGSWNPQPRIQLSCGMNFCCAIRADKTVKCWGENDDGQLGLGVGGTCAGENNRGNAANEMGANLPTVNLGTGRTPKVLAVGGYHACAILDNDTVKCWGFNSYGQAGQTTASSSSYVCSATTYYAQYTMGDSLPTVDLGTGVVAKSLSLGTGFSCAVMSDNKVKCWGRNNLGQLGLGDVNNRGDTANEMGDNLPYVNLGTGRTVKQLVSGGFLSCAILDNDSLKCWGDNSNGQLGVGDTANRGDAANEMGDNLPTLNLGTGRTAKSLAIGTNHSCAILDNDLVKCWGSQQNGELGDGTNKDKGDALSEMGDTLAYVSLGTGRTAKKISAGDHFTCVILDNDTMKCWGDGGQGQLGKGNTQNIGDGSGEMGDSLTAMSLGTGFVPYSMPTSSAGRDSTCAISTTNAIKCWGYNAAAALGLGDTANRGDNANEMGDFLPFVGL